mmetsp:Transcript_12992/g.32388  ORF Transcript_12992/g.32388 Transcript_12992/m.32388 type:complete len:262 (+) Transcript_12992:647-1432(+)
MPSITPSSRGFARCATSRRTTTTRPSSLTPTCRVTKRNLKVSPERRSMLAPQTTSGSFDIRGGVRRQWRNERVDTVSTTTALYAFAIPPSCSSHFAFPLNCYSPASASRILRHWEAGSSRRWPCESACHGVATMTRRSWEIAWHSMRRCAGAWKVTTCLRRFRRDESYGIQNNSSRQCLTRQVYVLSSTMTCFHLWILGAAEMAARRACPNRGRIVTSVLHGIGRSVYAMTMKWKEPPGSVHGIARRKNKSLSSSTTTTKS